MQFNLLTAVLLLLLIYCFVECRKPREYYDMVVISMGGVGCTNFLKRAGECRPHFSLNHPFNEDRLKHSTPKLFAKKSRNRTFQLGAVYITGNLSLAVASIVRRHYSLGHCRILRGDCSWLLRESINGNNLFFPTPKQELHMDANESYYSGSASLTVVRLQRILEYVGETQSDPLGLVSHYQLWKNYISDPSRNIEIGFLDYVSTTTLHDFSDFKVMEHLNISECFKKEGMQKKINRRGDTILTESLFLSNEKQRESMLKGLQFYENISVEMKALSNMIFPIGTILKL